MVAPPAKAHWEEIREAHGAVLHPLGPDTAWLATTPPPEKTKLAAALPAGSPLAGLIATVPRAGTVTPRRTVGTAPPEAAGPTAVTAPCTADGVELVR